jgi:hypothetical protein
MIAAVAHSGVDWAGIGAALAGAASFITAIVSLFQHLHLKKHDTQIDKLTKRTDGQPFKKDGGPE